MKKSGSLLVAVELLIIVLTSLASSYALLGTSLSFLIPFGVLLLLGIVTVVILHVGSFIFSAGSVLITLPALMKLNAVKWWLFTPERLAFCPTLSLPVALAIGLLVISGGLLLGYLQPLHRELLALGKDQANAVQSRRCIPGQILAVGTSVLLSAIVAAVVAVIIGAGRGGLAVWLKQLSWSLPVAGIVSFVALAMVIFWLIGAGRKGT